jgi:hypothetical protein
MKRTNGTFIAAQTMNNACIAGLYFLTFVWVLLHDESKIAKSGVARPTFSI